MILYVLQLRIIYYYKKLVIIKHYINLVLCKIAQTLLKFSF